MGKIIYIQGSGPIKFEYLPFKEDKGVKRLLSQFGDSVIIPKVLWHRNDNSYDMICDIIENNDIDALVGYSAGGYLAFYLSNKYDIPALLLNPAMVEGKGKYNNEAPTIQTIPEHIKELPINDKIFIVQGDDDRKRFGGVEPSKLEEMLQEIGFFDTKSHYYLIPGVNHDMTFELIKKSFELFYDEYLLDIKP